MVDQKIKYTLFIFAILATGIGCSNDENTVLRAEVPVAPPQNTPENTIRRFAWAYEQKNTAAYSQLFTADFTFEFSNDTDPDLVQQYSTGWLKEDEMVAATNLFSGGENNQGRILSAASRIELTLTNMVPVDDALNGKDPEKFKSLSTPVTLEIEVPPASGGEPEIFQVGVGADLTRHRIFLVRGDIATTLNSTQSATQDTWYIYRWVDESQSIGSARVGPETPKALKGLTWGWVKGLYR